VKTDRREFRFIDGSSRKFWAIELDGKSFSVHFGRIGTVGQAKEKAFSSEDLAIREYDKLVSEKTKAGYVEMNASGTASTPTPVPKRAAGKAEPTVPASSGVGRAAAVGKADPVGSEASASPAPATATGAAPDGELKRRVKLPDEDWARVRWRPLKPTRLPEPRSFDFEAWLKQATSAFTGWNYRANLAKDIPTRLSREEAWLWLNVLDTPSTEAKRLEDWLRAAHAAGLPSDAQVRERAKDIANGYEHGSFHYVTLEKAPQTLRPFFTPVEIADLMVQRVEASASRSRWPLPADASEWTMSCMLGFSAFVLSQMSEDERSEFRATMERLYDAEADPSSVRATAMLAFLSTVGGGARLAGRG
jgi:predicted DNA-binding WGR domain protein